MADNYVSLKIRADDTAKPDLTELKADLDELSHRAATARVDVDDEDGKLRLLDFNARLAELNKKVSRPRIDVAGAARAELQMARIRAEMDAIDRKSQEAPKQGILSRLLLGAEGVAGSGGGGGGGGGALAGLLGPLADVSGYALPAIGAAIAAVVVELDGLVSGFAAAGLGAGAFAALAMPAFKHISGAFQQIQSDTQAYDRALTKTARNTALAHLKQDWASLDPIQRDVIIGLRNVGSEFSKLAKAFEPTAYNVFDAALQVANNLLPALTPFATSFANAMIPILNRLASFTVSKGFKDWIGQMQSLAGPATMAIGVGIGHIAANMGKLLTIMSRKDVINAINIAFSVLDGTIIVLGAAIKFIMFNWDQMTHLFDMGRRTIAVLASDFKRDFQAMINVVESLWNKVNTRFRNIPDLILHAVASFGSLLVTAGEHLIDGLIRGIEGRIPGLSSVMSGVANVIKSFLPFSPARQGPLSGSGAPENSGRSIARQLSQGMLSGVGDVHAAMGRLTAAVGTPGVGRAGYGAYGAAGRQELVIRIEGGDEPIMRAFRQAIRVRGGNVQFVLGQGAG